MKLLEIKNNLVKVAYGEGENPILGRFIVLSKEGKSYVAQFVNLKSDTVNNFAIAKLLFTFTPDGVVDNYDGSIPSVESELSFLPAEELLNLLPIETAIKIGTLAQQEDILALDVSMFERNFTVFVENDVDKTVVISNCIRQLFRLKEKCVVVDTCNLFEDYPKIVFTKDFKLPLNSKMIDYIFEYELSEVDASTKAIIQDIFYAVQQYIKTLDFEFLPIDNFVDVVANQYKDIQMPELALLKNKLLKYRDANVFANTKEEVLALKEKLSEKNCSIIDLKDIHESLQKEVLTFIHATLEEFDKYIYFFAPLTDENSDKKLLKRFINHNHVFTTILVSNSYKYVEELKQHAQNMILFAPQNVSNSFAMYNTFLNKLNPSECIVYGKLTQGIPFIVDMADLELDLTKDDVLGEKYQFVPASEVLQFVKVDEEGNKFPVEFTEEEDYEPEDDSIDEEIDEPETVEELVSPIPEISQPPIEMVEPVDSEISDIEEVSVETVDELPAMELPQDTVAEPVLEDLPPMENASIVEPVANLLAEEDLQAPDELPFDSLSLENELPMPSELSNDEISEEVYDNFTQEVEEEPLTEDDLNFLEENQMAQIDEIFDGEDITEPMADIETLYEEAPYISEQSPVVPIYPTQDEDATPISDGDFQQGDSVSHPRYGRGVVEKIIKYGNKTLCSISFENVGRRLLDPTISELTKL